jgi:hypothetical protein
MQTNQYLRFFVIVFCASVSARAQVTEYKSEEIPAIELLPKFPIASSPASVTLKRNTCKANAPESELQSFPHPKVTVSNSTFMVDGVRFGYQQICIGPSLGEGPTTQSFLLGSLNPGKYSVTLKGTPGDFPPNPNTPRETAATLSTAFVVLSVEQAQRAILELPAAGSTQSGIGVVSGWACVADRAEMSINGGPKLKLSGESPRADVAAVCGHEQAGFGTLLNFNNLGSGSHSIQLYIKGVPVGQPTRFTVVVPAGEFARGLRKEVTVPDFPSAGKSSVLDWREAQQNFGIREVK